mgnify:CR=1 FL=1
MSKHLGQVQAAVEDFAEYAELVLGRSPNTVKGYVADLKGLKGYADTFDAFTLDALGPGEAVPRPVSPFYPAITKAVQDNAYAALTTGMSVDDATTEMEKAIQNTQG